MSKDTPDKKFEKWFDREHLRKDIKGRSITGGANTILAQVFTFVISLGSNIVLARLLLPADFGLVKMVTAVTGFILIFKDMGLSQAIVQRPQINHSLVSKTFWLNLLVSTGIALVIVALAPVLVAFYEEPELFNIVLVYAPIAFVSGFTIQHSALLQRQMQFKKLAYIKMASAALGVAVGIGMAWMGFGYWALLGLNAAMVLANVALVWSYCNWRPMLSRIDGSIGYIAKFGADMTGFGIINYFSRNLDNILIGRYVGESSLGFYDRAYQLLMVPITQLRDPLNSVGIPALSSLNPNSEDFSRYYYRFLFLMAFFSMPLSVFMGIAAEPIVLVLLGEVWMPSAEMFSLLAIVAFIQPVASTRGMVMISAGHSRKLLYWGLANATFTIAAFVIGISLGGTKGLIIGYISTGYLLLVPSLVYCFKGTAVKAKGFFQRILYPALFSAASGFLVFVVLERYEELAAIWKLLIAFVVFFGAYAVCWFALPGSRKRLKEVTEVVSYFVRKYKGKAGKNDS